MVFMGSLSFAKHGAEVYYVRFNGFIRSGVYWEGAHLVASPRWYTHRRRMSRWQGLFQVEGDTCTVTQPWLTLSGKQQEHHNFCERSEAILSAIIGMGCVSDVYAKRYQEKTPRHKARRPRQGRDHENFQPMIWDC